MWGAFLECTSLREITLGSTSVCVISGSVVFMSTLITNRTGSIYVPFSLVNDYKTANDWSYFSDRIFPIPE